MAFSLLRSGVKSTIGFGERSVIALVNAVNTNVEKCPVRISQTSTSLSSREKSSCLTQQMVRTYPLIITRLYSSKQRRERKKDYESDSDSDDDDLHYGITRKAESEFWRKKMRTLHGIFDVNKDGVISYDDFILLADRFTSLGHLSEQHEREFKIVIKKLWEKLWGDIDQYNSITVQKYLEDMHHVLNDKQLKSKVHTFLPYLFRAVDKDGSGEISVEEFKLFFECLGLSNEHAVISFNAIDTNQDGKLSLKEFVKLGRDFFIAEDEKRISRMFWGPLVTH